MRLSILAVALLGAAVPAYAETTLNFGAALEHQSDPAGGGTGNVQNASVYGEADFGGFYAGLSALKSTDALTDEIALAFGFRNEIGGLAYDVGYTQYNYPRDSASNYGELVLGLEKGFGDTVTGTFSLGYDVTNRAGNGYVGAEFAVTDAMALSANFGVYEVPGAGSEREWDLGATYALSDTTSIDLRYYDGSEGAVYVDPYFGLTLSWDTSSLLK